MVGANQHGNNAEWTSELQTERFVSVGFGECVPALLGHGVDPKAKCQTPQLQYVVLHVCFVHDMLCIVHKVRHLLVSPRIE
jgi:hypothetical protein